MKLALLALSIVALFSTSATAAPHADVTTARVVSVQTQWAESGETRVELEIGGQVVETIIGEGQLTLVPGEKAQVTIRRNNKRQWVIGPVPVQLVANN